MDWKTLRDNLILVFRENVTKDTPPEVVTIIAKLEVKLRSMKTEKEFIDFNLLCDRITGEVRFEMLKRLDVALR